MASFMAKESSNTLMAANIKDNGEMAQYMEKGL